VLGVDLVVIVVFLMVALSRKRWVKRQPGAFHGAPGGRRRRRRSSPDGLG
jgi:hypothetical protein